ncbi:MAG: glycosyl hydrolase 53 family protein [Bacteroidota bacterium]|nr:glycosyl hydrolase 53 family protein [Bacteroidota bacterium]
MRTFYILILVCLTSLTIYPQSDMIRGVDVSFLKKIEDNNGLFKENGVGKDALRIFKDHGVNYVRLRLWNNPSDGYSNLASTIQLAKRIKQMGMQWLLDFHYSDTWADPAHQTKPAAWANLTTAALKDSVYSFTKNTLLTLKQENVLPSMVQIGNEITGGMLWNDGRVGGAYETSAQWMNLTELLKKGLLAVQEINAEGAQIKTIIHLDAGGDSSACKWFLDSLAAHNVQYDYIGLSYYPWWGGPLYKLTANLSMLANRYNKEILLAETAYPWTLQWNDNTNNVVGQASQLLPGYPATVEGQTSFLNVMKSIIRNVPLQKGLGFFYWEPDWISTAAFGSGWENLALFDFSGEVLSSIHSFEQGTAVQDNPAAKKTFLLMQNYPNPFNPVTRIDFVLPERAFVILSIYNQLGQKTAQLLSGEKEAGLHSIEWNANKLATGVYFYELRTAQFRAVKKLTLIK